MKRALLHLIWSLGAAAGAGLPAAETPTVPLLENTGLEAPPGFYSVSENDKQEQVERKTPYGTIRIPTAFGTNVPYRFSIPLDQLKKNAPPIASLDPEKDAKGSEGPRQVDVVPLLPTGKAAPNQPGAPAAPAVVIDDADSMVVEANRLFNRRRFYEALTVVDQMLRKRPEFIRGWLMKGSLFLVQGHKDLAMKAWKKAQELDPANPEVQSVLSRYQ